LIENNRLFKLILTCLYENREKPQDEVRIWFAVSGLRFVFADFLSFGFLGALLLGVLLLLLVRVPVGWMLFFLFMFSCVLAFVLVFCCTCLSLYWCPCFGLCSLYWFPVLCLCCTSCTLSALNKFLAVQKKKVAQNKEWRHEDWCILDNKKI
jgi:hypothetical protein